MKSLLKSIVFLFLLTFCNNLKATHIVGGEMFYKCLGDNQYEITLTIFRDCYNGNPAAFFDDPADIGIYNSAGVLVDSLIIPFNMMLNDTLDPVLADPCLVVPPDVCVHTTTYVDTLTLLPRVGGYQLIYQRCCRNSTIVNIVDPLGSGATYGVNISERALNECNNSAVFSAWPPIYICAGEPIDFDQSAFDPDGDSIVYSLCTPLLGATPGLPEPDAFEQTVPADVTWVAPLYDVANMLNSNPSDPNVLKIDSQTGFLTGIPDVIGQFVVGICVEEYRDGELISTTRRDFQFNVGICGQAISSFFTPEVVCSNALEVLTQNNSDNATNYEWYFNDPLYPDSVVIGDTPSFIYSDTGDYIIMLIAQPGDECVDTSMLDIRLNFFSLGVNFDYEFEECSDTMTIAGTDFSTDSISDISEWYWNITDEFGNIVDISTDQNPSLQVGTSGAYTMELIVTAENGCMDSLEQTFEVNVIDEPMFPDSIIRCELDSVQLNPFSTNDYVYFWTPPNFLSDVNIASPWATPEVTTTYSLIIRDSSGNCESFRDITVVLPPPLNLNLTEDTVTCEPELTLFADSDVAVGFSWSTDSEFNVIFDTLPSVTVSPFGAVTYYIEVVDEFRCKQIDSVTIVGNGVNIEPNQSDLICDGETTIVSVINLDPADILTYAWSPISLIIDGVTNDTATVTTPGPGTWPYVIVAENQNGCTWLDTAFVSVLDTSAQLAFVSDQQCSGYSVQFTNQSINAPFMIWNFGDPLNPTATSTEVNPEYVYPGPGTFTVTLAINADVNCPDTFSVEIIVTDPDIVVDFDYTYEQCTDTTIVFFNDLSTNTQSTFTNWQWVFSNGDTILTQNPSIQLVGSQVLGVELTILSADGCEDVLAMLIPINLIDLNLTDTLTSCPGIAIELNPGGNPDYIYDWSPSTGLDNPNSPNPMASPVVTTTYTVTITEPSLVDCELIRTTTVVVPPIIEMTANNDTSVCTNAVELFASSEQAVSYTWSNVPTFSSVISSDSFLIAVPNEPTIYYVQVADAFGCTKEDTISVFGNSINVTVPDYTLCASDTLSIVPMNNDNGDVLSYDWSPVSEILEEDDNGTITVIAEDGAVFTTIVENQYGCIDTLESMINVYDYMPSIFASANPDTIFGGDTTQLVVTDSIGWTYSWTPANTLSNPNIFNPLAFPPITSTYDVQITTPEGCIATARVPVVVVENICEDPFVFFPNAFTPNGDGENDYLKVFGNYIEEVYWVVYNRWGEKIFEANSILDEWDGRFNDELLGPDVFGYYLEVRCVGGGEYKRKGNVTILK
ncbi:MAG: gliding motility-associated-like protein [Polaribacter sp.]|jgi:gliding motility-associated-like protein